jgi:MFS family permease
VNDGQPPPFRRDELTWFAFGMLGFYSYLLSGLGPLMPSLREELGLSYTIASLHFSAFAGGMILAGLVGDRVVRHYRRTKVFWGGAAMPAHSRARIGNGAVSGGQGAGDMGGGVNEDCVR